MKLIAELPEFPERLCALLEQPGILDRAGVLALPQLRSGALRAISVEGLLE